MIVLGLHGGVTINQHEPAAALLVDGVIAAVCEEERYLRNKGCYGLLPVYAIRAALKQAGLTMRDVDLIVTPGETYGDFDARVHDLIRHEHGHVPPIKRIHHQFAHLATAFYGSGHESALCLSLDASGDGSAGFVAEASLRDGIRVIENIPNSNSLGMFYTTMTHFLGFTDGDEYKVMGLAPYGKPTIDLTGFLKPAGGGWELDRGYIRSAPPVRSPFEPLYSPKLAALVGRENRLPSEQMTQFHKDLAASTQAAFEDALMRFVAAQSASFPHLRNLCYAGGIALNCVANHRLLASGLFDDIFVPPVASDRGLALGCAYWGAVQGGDRPQKITHAALGTSYSNDDIRQELESNGCRFEEIEDPAATAASLITDGRIVGWHQGRSEAGARALGNRSILARPGGIEVRDEVNRKIKFRESFRPFAPAVLAAQANEYFVTEGMESPFMCMTFPARGDQTAALGAVVHVDGTARVQTVSEQNGPFHDLLRHLNDMRGVPVVLNTSFNLKGQPIVETPRDALMTFFGCGLNDLVVGNFRVSK